MASLLFRYLSFIFSLVFLLLIELKQGRAILTINKETYDGVKNESISQNEGRKRVTGLSFLSNDHVLGEEDLITHLAALRWPDRGEDSFYGTVATLSVYALPEVGDDQTSSAAIWVVNHYYNKDFNGIVVGWQVNPRLYGDHDTHFFINWQGHEPGCYDLTCEGFVLHKDSKHIPGSKLEPLSTIDGPQFELSFKISRDRQTGDWWLYVGPNVKEAVGYWPKSLFTSLADGASDLQWGGVVEFYPNQKSPPMGSGLYPREGFGRAAFVKDVLIEQSDGIFSRQRLKRHESQTYCYQVDGKDPLGNDPYYFGGPGGCVD